MPTIRTHRISAGTPAASYPRSGLPSPYGVWKSAGLALAIAAVSLSAHAVPTRFEGLVQAAPPYQTTVPIQNNLFERQRYHAAGARVSFDPWVWDPVAREWVYAVAPGESWSWWWRDTRSGQVIAVHSVRFEGGEALCWSNGFCGPAGGWWAAVALRCMPEQDRYRVETYHDGNFLGADEFRPTPFRPKVLAFGVTESEISPDIPATQQNGDPRSVMPAVPGGETTVYLQLVDDLNCGVTIPGATVRLANTIVAGTGSHLHFSGPSEPGTGQYTGSTPAPSFTSDDKTEIEATTDANGQLTARYRAGPFGVQEQITATISYPKAEFEQTLTTTLHIRVPGLIPLDGTGTDYTLAGSYQVAYKCNDQAHNDGPTARRSHYVQPYTYGRIREMARLFRAETGITLSLNDASLEYGGVFDSGDSADRNRRCHWTHREGVDIDVNVGGSAGCPNSYNLNCLLGADDYPPDTRRRDFLDHLVTRELYGYKWIESTVHYRFQTPIE